MNAGTTSSSRSFLEISLKSLSSRPCIPLIFAWYLEIAEVTADSSIFASIKRV